ncbi:Putative zn(2)Cys(6) fungal-type DNA-binding domain, fungal transcription factor [Colletotrichum destructivum]|uniref:Zn(2)Cys(6) fungal-type DNA-binding domain, fungal transcription factor n=1 Tax=Colletotrichum destructivum TaxID=34406 RepID=A0AAX4IYG0_9PEZI|nr:Putative zn(2)Cys(6) fungal-type DNA-binding domain, fungal transcription factor [Colletotrichum destructivum]
MASQEVHRRSRKGQSAPRRTRPLRDPGVPLDIFRALSYREAGCGTCRTARIKCDETRPYCTQCGRRGVACSGYQVQLKWVEISDIDPDPRRPIKSIIKPRSSLTVGPSRTSAGRRPHPSIPRNPSPGPRLHSSSDVYIFTHWAESLPDLVYPNPDEYASIRGPYLAFVLRNNSVLLPAILAAGASHLHTLGIATPTDVLERKQKALASMVACVKQSALSFAHKTLPVYLTEEAMAATSALVGLEVMQGSPTSSIVPLLRGMKAQLEERRRAVQGKGGVFHVDQPTPMLAINTKMMAYIDTLCCVPCARKPVFDHQFWRDFVVPHCHVSFDGGPDIVFGYSTHILPLVGDSASLVSDLINKRVTPEEFVQSRRRLLEALDSCCRDLPPARHQPGCAEHLIASAGSLQIRDSNACLAAALAHGLATQVFLSRADENDPSTLRTEQPFKHPSALVEQLSSMIAAVPIDTHAATMMIWPLFVLGCESMATSARRRLVEGYLESMLAKHTMLNISVALELLRTRIWKDGRRERSSSHAESCPLHEDDPPSPQSQSDWVRLCWREKLELCSA